MTSLDGSLSLHIDGGGGHDTFTVSNPTGSLSSVQGTLSIEDSAHSGFDQLIIDNCTNPFAVRLTDLCCLSAADPTFTDGNLDTFGGFGVVQGFGMSTRLGFHGIDALQVLLGAQPTSQTRFVVEAAPANCSVDVRIGAPADVVTVGGGDLRPIKAHVTVVGAPYSGHCAGNLRVDHSVGAAYPHGAVLTATDFGTVNRSIVHYQAVCSLSLRLGASHSGNTVLVFAVA